MATGETIEKASRGDLRSLQSMVCEHWAASVELDGVEALRRCPN